MPPERPSHSFMICTLCGRICDGMTVIVDHRQRVESAMSLQVVLTLRRTRGALAGSRSLTLLAIQCRNISRNVSAGKGDCTGVGINDNCGKAACRAHFPVDRRPSGIKKLMVCRIPSQTEHGVGKKLDHRWFSTGRDIGQSSKCGEAL